jgi:HEAT repeat protein
VSTVTVGRKPTLGEVIDYYTRDDFLRLLLHTRSTRRVVLVISEKAHWEPDWGRYEVTGESTDDLGQFIRQEIAARLPGVGLDDRPDYYPSFHQAVWQRSGDGESVQDGGKRQRHLLQDCVFEADLLTWRDAFQDVFAIVDLLRRHNIPYWHKFSGHRSLHVVIPGEVIPKGYRGKGALNLARLLLQWGGSQAHQLPKITRMPYSLNEDTGLVCLPIERDMLEGFRPWQANLHLVEIRHSWTGRCSEGDLSRVETFVETLKTLKPGEMPRGEGEHRAFFTPSRELVLSYGRDRFGLLRGDGDVGRAWRLLAGGSPIPEATLLEGLLSTDADARWLTVEAFYLRGASLSNAGLTELLEQDEEYARPAAVDVLLRFEDSILPDLVELIGDLYRYSATGIRATYLLSQSDSLRQRVLGAIYERTGRSHDALIASACLAGSMMGDWRGADRLLEAVRRDPGLSELNKRKLAALEVMKELGGWNKREEAKRAQSLATLGGDVTDLLLIAAAGPNRRFRRGIVTALAMLADERAVHLLVRSLGDDFSQVRRKAIPGLIRIGEAAVDPLIEATTSDQVPVRRYAIHCLGCIGAPRAKPAILDALDDGEDVVRHQAIRALQHLATEEDIDRLKQVLRDESFDRAEEAVAALEVIGDAGKQALRDLAFEEYNPAGAFFVAREGDPRGREILAERLREGDPQRENAAEFLRELRDERCIPFFADVLRTTMHWRGAFIALELGRIGTPAAVAALIEALSSNSQHVRRGAVRGLTEAGDPVSIEPLIRCLVDDEDSKVRGLAGMALVEVGEEAALPLAKALKEGRIEGKHRQNTAKNVLQRLGLDVESL